MTENKTIKTSKEEPDLYKRSIKGGYWVFVIRFATQFFGFVKSIIIFNFLFKANLELVIIANLLMALLITSTESGFHAALIQKKENIEDYLDTAWVIGILRGILLFALIYFLAPLFASFKVDPENVPLAISVIRAMGVCFLIQAFQNIGVVFFQKELQFHKTFWLTMAGTLTDIVLSIILVLILKSVWGYVIARLVTAAVNLAMTYLLCSYRPRFHFVPQKARELWKFGKWLFAGNIMGYLLNEGDDWFVWFYLGGQPLKIYQYGYRFSHMPSTHISEVISKISFPAYSKIQNDLPRLREAYYKVVRITALISAPASLLIFILCPDFVRLFLVEESQGIIPIIQILALRGLLGALGATRGPLFKASGRPSAVWKLRFSAVILLSVLIYPCTARWGIIGTSVLTLGIAIFVNSIGIHIAKNIIKCSVWDIRKPTYIPLIASVLVGLMIMTIKTVFGITSSYLSFAVISGASVLTYILIVYILDRLFPSGFRAIIVEQLKVFRIFDKLLPVKDP